MFKSNPKGKLEIIPNNYKKLFIYLETQKM